MRKIVLWLTVSLDGFFEGPNRELDWGPVDEELHAHFNQVLGDVSLFIEGRVTYELMAAYWPTADQDPAASPTIAEFARIWRDTPKLVFSRTLDRADWNATILREVDPEQIRALKAQPGGDMVLGSADLAATFHRLDLFDEYRIYVAPVVLGQGRRPFAPSDAPTPLRLVETRAFGNGVVLLRYQRSDANGA